MLISIDGVSKIYPTKAALKNITLGFSAGLYGILGKNGAGKTTLFKLMTGLISPSEGTITMDGKPGLGDRIGYLPQEFGFPGFLKVDEILHQIAVMRGFSKKQAPSIVNDVLD